MSRRNERRKIMKFTKEQTIKYLEDLLATVQRLREEGEPDLRTVIYNIEELIKQIKEQD